VKLGPAHPRVLELKNQLSQVQTSLNTEISNVGGRIENEYRAAMQQEKMLRAALDQQKQQANALNQAAITYNLLKRDVETSRQLYEGLLTKMKEASVSAGLKANNIRLVDVARVPAHSAHPNLPLNIGLGFFASIVLGVAFAFAREAMDNTVRTPEDVQMVAGLPSLGMVPLNLAPKRVEKQAQALLPRSAAQEGRPSILTHAAPSSHLAEAYRAIRSALLLSSSGKPPQVILISSPLPGDGKTTTSVNTAIVLAQNGGRVLLIDADLRRSQVHKALGLPNGPGLSAVLSGNETLESQITRSREVPNLFVLTAGAAPPYPAELLGSQKMSELIQQFRKDFDFVVIDTPPLISVTDAVILSRQVDGILLVVHSGKTNKGALSRARELLALVNARVLGVLVNAVDLHSQAGYYSYGYGYSYAKYYGDYSSNSSTTAAAGK